MSEGVDAFQLRDPGLRPVAEKVLATTRLEAADALALYATADLLGLGATPRHIAQGVGDLVWWIVLEVR